MTLDMLKDLEKHYRKVGGKKNTFAADACREIWEAHRLAIIRNTFNKDDNAEMTLSKVATDYYRKSYNKFLAMQDSKSAEAIKVAKKLFITPYNLSETKNVLQKIKASSYEEAYLAIKTRSDYNKFDMDIVKNCLESLDF